MSQCIEQLFVDLAIPAGIAGRLTALLRPHGCDEAIDLAMMDMDLVDQLLGPGDEDLRKPLGEAIKASRPLIDGWSRGMVMFGLGSGGGSSEEVVIKDPPRDPLAPVSVSGVLTGGVEPVESKPGLKLASRLLRGGTLRAPLSLSQPFSGLSLFLLR